MKARVIKASKDTYWYSDKIGKVFKVKEKTVNRGSGDKYELKSGGAYLDANDVELIGDKRPEKVVFT